MTGAVSSVTAGGATASTGGWAGTAWVSGVTGAGAGVTATGAGTASTGAGLGRTTSRFARGGASVRVVVRVARGVVAVRQPGSRSTDGGVPTASASAPPAAV